MNVKQWAFVALGAVALVGCSSKPKPTPPEPPPPQMEPTATPAAPTPAAKVDEEALRRQRIQARIAEVFKPIYFGYDQSTITAEGQSTKERVPTCSSIRLSSMTSAS